MANRGRVPFGVGGASIFVSNCEERAPVFNWLARGEGSDAFGKGPVDATTSRDTTQGARP